MGPFEWLASRWTPEFEYRDRLADEVEDIAYESTRTGTRRGFLVGALVGVIIALIGIGALASNGVQIPFLSTAELQKGPREATVPQPASEELSILKRENEQLKKELAAKAEASPSREKRVVETKPRQPKPEAGGAFPPREKRVVETKPPEPKPETPAERPSKTVATEVAATPEKKVHAPAGLAAQPIPSNCRKEGECDPIRR
ncbi:MAG: hypothetical protein A2Z31_02690 [candidate division NC10 bacterium RBG_16_65_8]|nr:MAG: hypothetical protein A2Z31_02690 [candidate division NC10 bacterium RBG_16_65_8]